jgi:hypothetical protein
VTTFDARINHILPFARATVYYMCYVNKKYAIHAGAGKELNYLQRAAEVDFNSMGCYSFSAFCSEVINIKLLHTYLFYAMLLLCYIICVDDFS